MKSAKQGSLLLLCFWLSGMLVASYPAFAAHPERLLLTTSDRPPYQTFSNGFMGGLAVNRVKCVLNKLKQPYQLTMTKWTRAQLLVEAGIQDAFFIATETPHRNQFAMMSDSMFQHHLYFYFSDMVTDTTLTPTNKLRWRTSAIFGTSEWSNLYEDKFRVIGKPRDAAKLVDMLLNNRVDAVLAYQPAMEAALSARGLLSNRFRSNLKEVEKAGVYFRKSFLSQYPGFLDEFNHAIPKCSATKR